MSAKDKISRYKENIQTEKWSKVCRILDYQCKNNSKLTKILNNERFNYSPPKHNKNIIDFICKISVSIQEQKKVAVKYERQDGKIKEYNLMPLGLVFSEYYFYLVGEIIGKDKKYNVVFMVDRFHKKIQFMYTGELVKIQFKFCGDLLEAILDRLPNAKVLRYDEKDSRTIIEAEVYGEGVKRCILSKKELLEVLRPEAYRNEIKETVQKILDIYKN